MTKEAEKFIFDGNWGSVNNIMKQTFPSIVDANFTANMEGLLDMLRKERLHGKM